MSPLGKPLPDGSIVTGSRKSRFAGALGTATIWTCAGCGVQVEGRKIEEGCPHCGAGDPSKGIAGQPARAGDNIRDVDPLGAALADEITNPSPGWSGAMLQTPREIPAAPIRILRLIEYLITPGQDADEVLRRSLIGTLRFPWGQLTGTIVDSCDSNQEDRLRLAKRQPGVWLGNASAMERPGPVSLQDVIDAARLARSPLVGVSPIHAKDPEMTTPAAGPAFTHEQALLAKQIVTLGGFKLAYTLALALSQIAPELDGNSEPEKFLTGAEALQLGNALMALIPDDWQQPTSGGAPTGESNG